MILIYGLPKGETERYKEELLYTKAADIEEAEAWAEWLKTKGWHSIRIATFIEENESPNFGGTLNI